MPKMQLRRGGSDHPEPQAAMAELRAQIGAGDGIAFVLIFASPDYDRGALARAIAVEFAGTTVYGCTTAGEITPFGYISGGLSGVSFPAEDFAVVAGLFEELQAFEIGATIEKTRQLMAERDALLAYGGNGFNGSFGLLLIDGLSVREEQLVSAVGNTLAGTPLVGGSAGDGLDFKQSFVFFRDHFVSTRRRFSVFKTEHFVPTDEKMVVTGADLEHRRVLEINAEPAALEYARLVGLDGEALSPKIFAAHPVVVRVGGQYHVRAIQKVNPDNSLTFLCAIDEGLVLTLAEGVDLIQNLKELFGRLERDVGPPDVILGCDCVLRNIELEQRQLKRAVSSLFVEHRVVGFCTYGEQYMSMHVNQTFTGVAIGAP